MRGPWNGRQIRKAVQIAACLALFEHKDDPKNLPAVLTAEHFRTVHASMTKFDMCMTKAQRADNSKMAHMAGDRFDGYGEDVESHEPVEYEGFANYGAERRSTPMRSTGHGIGPVNSRGQPTQRRVFRQNPGPGPSRGRYPDASYAAGRGHVPYQPSARYSEAPMEEDDESFHVSKGSGRRPPLLTHEAISMEEVPEDKFLEHADQEQASEYELHSSEDDHLEVKMSATKDHRNTLVFDHSLGSINNPPSVSGTRMSGRHATKKPGFQRQGCGS